MRTLQKLTEEQQRIKDAICKALNPEYILLFGTATGGTQHSDVLAYDILVVTEGTPRYDWQQLKHFLKLHIPPKSRDVTYLNLYVHSQYFVDHKVSALLHFAKTEGLLLYSRDKKLSFNSRKIGKYLTYYQTASKDYATFFELGSQLLVDSGKALKDENLRLSAFYMSRATEMFYKTLFLVYHNFDIKETDIRVLHQRLRTLSAELIMLFDSDSNKYSKILNSLNFFRDKSLLEVDLVISGEELVDFLGQITHLQVIVKIACERRIEFYRGLL